MKVELKVRADGALTPIYAGGKDEAEVELSGLLNEEKVDMGNAKVDIENEKVDIESVLPEKDSNFCINRYESSICTEF